MICILQLSYILYHILFIPSISSFNQSITYDNASSYYRYTHSQYINPLLQPHSINIYMTDMQPPPLEAFFNRQTHALLQYPHIRRGKRKVIKAVEQDDQYNINNHRFQHKEGEKSEQYKYHINLDLKEEKMSVFFNYIYPMDELDGLSVISMKAKIPSFSILIENSPENTNKKELTQGPLYAELLLCNATNNQQQEQFKVIYDGFNCQMKSKITDQTLIKFRNIFFQRGTVRNQILKMVVLLYRQWQGVRHIKDCWSSRPLFVAGDNKIIFIDDKQTFLDFFRPIGIEFLSQTRNHKVYSCIQEEQLRLEHKLIKNQKNKILNIFYLALKYPHACTIYFKTTINFATIKEQFEDGTFSIQVYDQMKSKYFEDLYVILKEIDAFIAGLQQISPESKLECNKLNSTTKLILSINYQLQKSKVVLSQQLTKYFCIFAQKDPKLQGYEALMPDLIRDFYSYYLQQISTEGSANLNKKKKKFRKKGLFSLRRKKGQQRDYDVQLFQGQNDQKDMEQILSLNTPEQQMVNSQQLQPVPHQQEEGDQPQPIQKKKNITLPVKTNIQIYNSQLFNQRSTPPEMKHNDTNPTTNKTQALITKKQEKEKKCKKESKKAKGKPIKDKQPNQPNINETIIHFLPDETQQHQNQRLQNTDINDHPYQFETPKVNKDHLAPKPTANLTQSKRNKLESTETTKKHDQTISQTKKPDINHHNNTKRQYFDQYESQLPKTMPKCNSKLYRQYSGCSSGMFKYCDSCQRRQREHYQYLHKKYAHIYQQRSQHPTSSYSIRTHRPYPSERHLITYQQPYQQSSRPYYQTNRSYHHTPTPSELQYPEHHSKTNYDHTPQDKRYKDYWRSNLSQIESCSQNDRMQRNVYMAESGDMQQRKLDGYDNKRYDFKIRDRREYDPYQMKRNSSNQRYYGGRQQW